MNIDKDTKVKLFYSMLRIRLIEEAIAHRYHEQKMRTPVHLSIGQEAVATAAGHVLKSTDYAVSTHRAHAHYFAKGGSLNAMIAELYGKVTGCSRGRGGSMHLIDRSVGFMGSTAIVGNTIPIGVGFALSSKLMGEEKVSCIFVGDGAIEEGVFYESLNFAVLKKLPVMFICENNYYSVYTPIEKRQPKNRELHKLANAIGAATDHGDGNDVLECYEKINKAVNAIRQGEGPYFLEFATYRWREHCGPNYDNDLGYRTVEEFENWKLKDPITKFKAYLIENCHLTDDIFKQMEIDIQQEINAAFSFAEQSPFPDAIEAITGQYKEMTNNQVLNEEENTLYCSN